MKLRWNPERCVIYSVGYNGHDDGGHQDWHTGDITVRYR
jgi:hypothetical protein